MTRANLAFVSLLLAGATACGGGSGAHHAPLPLVTPPVRAAAPAALRATLSARRTPLAPSALVVGAGTLDPAGFQARFFAPGPTDLFGILGAIDQRIAGINSRLASADPSPCLAQPPVAFELTPWGQAVPFYAQCYERVTGPDGVTPAGFVQWAEVAGAFYLYAPVGAGHVAAIVTPVAGVAGSFTVHAWIGVGYTNVDTLQGTWDSGSYGVIEIQADPGAGILEMTAAGVGLGFCGAQLRSDGTSVFGVGSIDMGASCVAADSLCVAASDLAAPGICADGAPVTALALPPIGRLAAQGSPGGQIAGQMFAESLYPAGGGNVTLDGSAGDALAIGPAAPTPGASAF
jgi:hypothetical protein